MGSRDWHARQYILKNKLKIKKININPIVYAENSRLNVMFQRKRL